MDMQTHSVVKPQLDDYHEDHLENFKEFCEQLNEAAKKALPRVYAIHTAVFVLLLRWEDDDLGTETEVIDLEQVFKEIYHYNTERYLIPSDDPTNQLEYKLNDFRRAHDNGTNLLIIYYGGHGHYSKESTKRSVWQANLNGGAKLVWSELQGILERAKSDVIFILDCCFAASAASRGGAKEGLWACNSEVATTGVSENSFTRNLIEELKSISESRFSVAMLHASLMRRYRKPGPHTLLTEPWYTFLGDSALSSTVLIPQPQTSSASNDSITTEAQIQTTQKSSEVAPPYDDQSIAETLVLLAVRLNDTTQIPNLSSWQKWCHDLAPDDVESVNALGRLHIRNLVKLEAYFHSHSAIMLVSMPIFIWDMLPSKPSYSFVGFIKSANLLFPSLGEEHHSTLTGITKLALAFGDQGRWKEAEELELLVIDTRKRLQGAEHHSTLTSMTNLALAYGDQGRWKEAEDLELLVMKTRKRVLGAEHPDTLVSIASIARTFRNQERWKEAEELGIQVMEIRKRVLGAEHPNTLASIASVARTFRNQERWKEAEELGIQVMETRKRVLGVDHPNTLASIASVARTFKNQERWKEAEKLEIHVMETRKRVLGAEHPDTLASIANLAWTFKLQKRWKEADQLELQVLETDTRVRSPNTYPIITSNKRLKGNPPRQP